MSTNVTSEKAERLPEKTVSAHPVKPLPLQDNETLSPQVASPGPHAGAERIPILIEITEEDRQNASSYTDTRNCLICTALKRMGYECPGVGGSSIYPDGDRAEYIADDILPLTDLYWNLSPKSPRYDSKVVGKQIILYPV